MFDLEQNNKIIGQYLLKLITEKFENQRRFCQAYISYVGGEVNDDETRKMANRISQMIQGKKAIQTYDLPIFTKLLDVTCEEILSAEKTFVPQKNHLTNYGVAFSRDKHLWEEYINHKDRPFLNPDEYSNTVLDYAIKFKNFDFIEYLFDEKIIWFDKAEDKNPHNKFGAGTSIKDRNIGNVDYYLPQQLRNEKLRMKLIALAVQNNSLKILISLRAKEIPEYYNASYFLICKTDLNKYYDKELIAGIAASSNEIVDYFTNGFDIRDPIEYEDGIERKHRFIFPFISEVLDDLIKYNHGLVEFAIRKSIEHNRDTYTKLKTLIDNMINAEDARHGLPKDSIYNEIRDHYTKDILNDISFNEEKSIIALFGGTDGGLITNIIQSKNKSQEVKINYLIEDLNNTYNQIINIRNEFE